MNASNDLITDARLQVHATFTVSTPTPLFVVAVEVLEGTVSPNMFMRIPLNQSLDITVRIRSIETISNSWGLSLQGLCIQCLDDTSRQFIDALHIGDEILVASQRGED